VKPIKKWDWIRVKFRPPIAEVTIPNVVKIELLMDKHGDVPNYVLKPILDATDRIATALDEIERVRQLSCEEDRLWGDRQK